MKPDGNSMMRPHRLAGHEFALIWAKGENLPELGEAISYHAANTAQWLRRQGSYAGGAVLIFTGWCRERTSK